MSHLIPTPVTDKNGVTSIRHLKPQATSATGRSAIPPVGTPALSPQPASLGQRVRLVVSSIPNFRVPIPDLTEMSSGMRVLIKEVPELAETIDFVTSEGSPGARKATALYLMDHVKMMRMSVLQKSNIEDLVPKLMEIWHGENVAEESGHVGEIDFSRSSAILILDKRYTRNFSDEQRRGFAVFRLAFETKGAHSRAGDTMKFINWAGRQQNLALIIEFAKTRGILDPDELTALIAGAGSSPSLREGAL